MIELVPGGTARPRAASRSRSRPPAATSIDPGVLGHHACPGRRRRRRALGLQLRARSRSTCAASPRWTTTGRRSAAHYYAPEAVKAQAVAARTYAVAKNGATLSDNWADQCYRGYTLRGEVPGHRQGRRRDTAGLRSSPTRASPSRPTSPATPAATPPTRPGRARSRPTSWPSPIPGACKAPPSGIGRPGLGLDLHHLGRQPLRQGQRQSQGHLRRRRSNVGPISRRAKSSRATPPTRPATPQTLRLTGESGTATVSVSSFRSLIGSSNLPSTLILTINGDPGGTSGDPTTRRRYIGVHGVDGGPLDAGRVLRCRARPPLPRRDLAGGHRRAAWAATRTVSSSPRARSRRAQFAKIAVEPLQPHAPGRPDRGGQRHHEAVRRRRGRLQDRRATPPTGSPRPRKPAWSRE